MNSAQLMLWLSAKPFKPFRIVMSDGGGLEIFHPEQVVLFRSTAIVGRRGAAGILSERDTTISLLHVVRLEPLQVVG